MLALWQKIRNLPLAEVLVVEADPAEKDLTRVKSRIYAQLQKLVKTANFALQMYVNKQARHVAIVKLAKAAK